MNEIVEMATPMYISRLKLFKPELAQWFQYMGFDEIGDSRVRLNFRSSQYGVSFSLDFIMPSGINKGQMLIHYTELFGLFRDVKYKFLKGEL